MNDWEFLLQKQGDSACLPLESPSAEILEGHYQVIARLPSARISAETAMTVQIVHLFESEGVVQRHWQQRSLQASPEVVVLPLAYLAAGRWTLSCSTQTATGLDVVVDPEVQTLQLQVLAPTLDSLEFWDPPLPTPIIQSPAEAPPNSPPLPLEPAPASAPALDLPTFSYPTTAWCLKVVEGPTLPPKLFEVTAETDPKDKSPTLPPLPRREQPAPARAAVTPPSTPLATALASVPSKERFWENLQALSRDIIAGDRGGSNDFDTAALSSRYAPQAALSTLAVLPRPASLGTPAEIPVPDLVIQDILAEGRPLSVTVRLPRSVSGIGVKLWVSDRQTRALLDGPRWLMDFLPQEDLDLQEALIQITLPLEVEAVSFAAIAVDLQTQRESHRTIVHRQIREETPR
jgi:hypothetical protein